MSKVRELAVASASRIAPSSRCSSGFSRALHRFESQERKTDLRKGKVLDFDLSVGILIGDVLTGTTTPPRFDLRIASSYN